MIGEFTPQTQQQGALYEGLANLAPEQNRQFTFSEYTRVQLSQDGYVFWVAAQNQIVVNGLVHIATERDQQIDNTIAMNSIILTSESEINEFNKINPSSMWIMQLAMPGGVSVPVAFQRRGPFFAEAGVYHYAGFAVFPPFGPQLINSEADLPTEPIVSNSLPIWLAQNTYAPVYPSFLVPENIQPPYVVAHIEPELTRPIQAVPYFSWPGGTGTQQQASYQLYYDFVELILYGFNNQTAQQYYASLIEASLNDDTFGFSGELPAIRDDKRVQAEISAIAMKKTLSFGASYYQTTADAVARKLILSATISYFEVNADSSITVDNPIFVAN